MLIYLTSTAAKTINRLVPFLPKPAAETRVAFIPTASDIYDPHPWVEDDRTALIRLGFRVEDVDLKTCHGEVLRKRLSESDIIFVAGGNTSYLLEQAQLSGFIDIVRKLVRAGKYMSDRVPGRFSRAPISRWTRYMRKGTLGKRWPRTKGSDSSISSSCRMPTVRSISRIWSGRKGIMERVEHWSGSMIHRRSLLRMARRNYWKCKRKYTGYPDREIRMSVSGTFSEIKKEASV